MRLGVKERPIRLYSGSLTVGTYPEPTDYPQEVAAVMIAKAKMYCKYVREVSMEYLDAMDALITFDENAGGVRSSNAKVRSVKGRTSDRTAGEVISREQLRERIDKARETFLEARDTFLDVLQNVDSGNAYKFEMYCLECRSWGYVANVFGTSAGDIRRDCAYIAIYLHMPDGWR